MESVYSDELKMLRQVFSTSSDLVMAYRDQDFRDACGGLDVVKELHLAAVRTLETWYDDGDDSHCR
jgi:hypothetical protein